MSQSGILSVTGNDPQIPTEFIADIGTAIPVANQLEILGDTQLAGTSPVETTGSGNTITVLNQLSQAIAAADATKVGLSNFDSNQFIVDADGFVSLVGGGASTTITVDDFTAPGTNPVLADGGGSITITGAQVATGTIGANVIRTDSLAANELTIEIQRSTAVAAADTTKNGVSHYDSDHFTVDSDGFVSLSGGGLAIDSISPDSGTDPVVPNGAGLVNIIGDGSTTTVGSLNTLTIQLTGLTANNVLIGAGTTTITKVAPSATTGVALVSQGAAVDPAFDTVVVAGGGTGDTSLTDHGVLLGSGTSPVTVTAVGTDGQVLIGATAADPAFATITSTDGSINFTTGANSLDIEVAGGVATVWENITANQTLEVGHGYFVTSGALDLLLPATSVLGDSIVVVLRGGTSWTVTQDAGQQIFLGNASTTAGAGGSLASTADGDSIKMVCQTDDLTWVCTQGGQGNITIV